MPYVDSKGNYRNHEGKVVRKATAEEMKSKPKWESRKKRPKSIQQLREMAEEKSGNKEND